MATFITELLKLDCIRMPWGSYKNADLDLVVLEEAEILQFLSLFFLFFRAAPMTYRGSQGRGPIRAILASLRRSHLYHSTWQRRAP